MYQKNDTSALRSILEELESVRAEGWDDRRFEMIVESYINPLYGFSAGLELLNEDIYNFGARIEQGIDEIKTPWN